MASTLNLKRLAIVGDIDLSAEQVALASLASNSVAVLLALNGNSGQSSHGTAMCVDRSGLFLTARHYVSDLEARLVLSQRDYEAKAVAVDDERDLVLFQVAEPIGELLEPVDFALTMPEAGTPVLGLGHVVDGDGYKLGAYSARYLDCFSEVMNPAEAGDMPSEWLSCAQVFEGAKLGVPGFSGGPILTPNGRVAALTSFGDGDRIVVGPSGSAAHAFVTWYRQR